LRERYHRLALARDFGIDRRRGRREPTRIDPRREPGLNVIGYFGLPTGLGESARSVANAAERAGLHVARRDVSPGASRPEEAPYDVNLYHVNADGAAATVEEVGPRQHAGRANVGYWYWETESFPERWRDRFDYFDEIWVATEFCRRAIAPVSPIPVRLVSPAVEPPEGRQDPKIAAGIDASDFLVLSVFDALSVAERKNPLGTVRAFARAFGDQPRAHLLLQVSHAEHVAGLLERLRQAGLGARVTIRTGTLERADLENLLAACDVYVSLHRAEGFGLPIAEAMAAGKPVVVTDYSGSVDYLDESTGFPVRWQYAELSQGIRDYARGTRWADPDEADAARLLRRVFEDPGEAARRGQAARLRMEERYGPEAAGRRIVSALGELRERLRATA
ncbi:MAG TPA: glycosyltransferase family 4 protein, partial [Thermoanaerobaculia bacterium]|nr:glycosyltransferase family 4 protein [Thermoanaerobaculia bacterium]